MNSPLTEQSSARNFKSVRVVARQERWGELWFFAAFALALMATLAALAAGAAVAALAARSTIAVAAIAPRSTIIAAATITAAAAMAVAAWAPVLARFARGTGVGELLAGFLVD
jgi:hypothetical protein